MGMSSLNDSTGFSMSEPTSRLRIMQVNTSDDYGGAAKVARSLHNSYRSRGYPSWLVVGHKYSEQSNVLQIPPATCRTWRPFVAGLGENALSPLVGKVRGAWRLRNLLSTIGDPSWSWANQRGYEDFNFPQTWRLGSLTNEHPDIVHCHNLHGGYFDLRALPSLSQQFPVVLTLHDAWTMSGHCAHSFDCDRWKTGCGDCPDLTIYPAIGRDRTAYNWKRKQQIYARCRFYLAAPSKWLIQKVEQSMLATALIETKVIHNGVDLSIFFPGDREVARARLNIPKDVTVLLFAGSSLKTNLWKDYATMRASVEAVARQLGGREIRFIALGDSNGNEEVGQVRVQFVPYQKDPASVARYYQAADIYLHAARIDTFPNSVLEALACGIPVVATAVGGIPEQIQEGRTGFLVPPGDVEVMTARLTQLLSDERLRKHMGQQAAEDVRERFDLRHQVDVYLTWYEDIVNSRRMQ
jgi:glycosyltransferase involved in cell wall biosynthesis